MTAREPAVASRAAQWLEDQGLEVYQEVECHQRRADLVGAGSEVLIVVECKLRLGLDLIEQAEHWKPYANARICAYLDARTRRPFRSSEPRTRQAALRICREWGIGVLRIPEDERDPLEEEVRAIIQPRPRAHDYLRDALAPEQRLDGGAAEAGTNRGGYHTPFRRTALLVSEIVSKHPEGIQVSDLLDTIKERGGHHYASDKGFKTSILLVVKRGIVPGVRIGKKAFGRKASVLVPVEGGGR